MDRNVKKLDIDWTNVFINTIVKNIQTVCNGIIPFSQNIEVIGHLHLSIDSDKKVNYIVNEKCSKQDTFVNSTSESFHAEPKEKPVRGTPRSRKKKASPSKIFDSPAKSMKFCESFDMKGDTVIDEVLDDISVDSSLGVTFTEHQSETRSRSFLTDNEAAINQQEFTEEQVVTIENMGDGSKIETQNSDTNINQLNIIKPEDEASTSNVSEFYFDPDNPEATLCVIATDDCKRNIEAYYAGNLNIEGDTTLDDGTSESALDSQSLNETDTNYEPDNHVLSDKDLSLNKDTMFVMSSYTADQILNPRDAIVQRLFSSIVKDASIYSGLWETCPYPRDIPSNQRDKFFTYVLSIVPQLAAHTVQIWSKLSQRLRDRRFKQKAKERRKNKKKS